MKTIGEYINESIFDTNKVLEPFEKAVALKDYEYNTTDGGKDCIGQPLQEGDLVIVFNDIPKTDGIYPLQIAVYLSKKGSMCEYCLSHKGLTSTAKEVAPYSRCRAKCSKVFKINQNILNI